MGVLAGLLAVAFQLDFPGQICEYNQATKHEDCATYSLFPFLFIQIAKTLNDYGVAITGIATVLLAIITGWLVSVARDQSDTTRAQLRAYVFVTQTKITKLPGKDPSIVIVFTNTGQTPAYEMTLLNNKRMAEYPLETPLISHDAPIRVGSLGAGQHSISVLEFSLTDNERQEMSTGNLALYVFGRIEYKDAFRRKQWGTYTFIGGGPAPVGPNGELSIYANGSNDAT